MVKFDLGAPGVTLDALRAATLAKFPEAFDRSVAGSTGIDWHKPVTTPRVVVPEEYFVRVLSQAGDRSAIIARTVNRCMLSGWTAEETFEALAAHEDMHVLSHYGETLDEDRLRKDVERLWQKPNPNQSDEAKFGHIVAGANFGSAGSAAVAPMAAGREKYVLRIPAEDAAQPPLAYWDRRRQGILPRIIGGCVVIAYGERSSHKTGVILKECLDAVFGKGARVLYLAAEGAHGIWTARLPAACKHRGRSVDDLNGRWHTLAVAPNLLDFADIDTLIATCREAGFSPDIIVIDTLTRAVHGDINAPAVGAAATMGMERLGAAFDATVIAITHPGKDESRKAIGSSLFDSLAFAVWKVRLSGETVFVTVEKMKDGPADFTVAAKIASGDDGVPVVVDVASGEALPLPASDNLVTEATVRGVLIAKAGYGKKEGITEARLCELLCGPKPVNPSDEHSDWVVRRVKIAHGLRSARQKREWAKRLCEEWTQPGATKTEWFWFRPEGERPVPGAFDPPTSSPF